MKRILTLTLTLGLLLTLTACGYDPTQPTVTTTTTTAATTTTTAAEPSPETSVVSDTAAASKEEVLNTSAITDPPTTTTTDPTATTTRFTKQTVIISTTAKTAEATVRYITRDEAVRAALEHAKVKQADARDLDVEFDVERATPVYEVDFEVGQVDYDYEIHAVTGAVVSYFKEDAKNSTGFGGASQTATRASGITYGVAEDNALKHAGLTREAVRDLEADLDSEDGVYDVSFEADGLEYEYVIDAKTGAVVRFEKEPQN